MNNINKIKNKLNELKKRSNIFSNPLAIVGIVIISAIIIYLLIAALSLGTGIYKWLNTPILIE